MQTCIDSYRYIAALIGTKGAIADATTPRFVHPDRHESPAAHFDLLVCKSPREPIRSLGETVPLVVRISFSIVLRFGFLAEQVTAYAPGGERSQLRVPANKCIRMTHDGETICCNPSVFKESQLTRINQSLPRAQGSLCIFRFKPCKQLAILIVT